MVISFEDYAWMRVHAEHGGIFAPVMDNKLGRLCLDEGAGHNGVHSTFSRPVFYFLVFLSGEIVPLFNPVIMNSFNFYVNG